MVTESIMKWVFWYLSYIMSSYKHWNVECVGDNHPLIVLNVWLLKVSVKLKWVFWYLSYIMSSYKHWNVECVGDNHPLIVLNKIGCTCSLFVSWFRQKKKRKTEFIVVDIFICFICLCCYLGIFFVVVHIDLDLHEKIRNKRTRMVIIFFSHLLLNM